MIISKLISQGTLRHARRVFNYASIATDASLAEFIASVIVKPILIAFLGGFCAGIIACLILRAAQ